MALKTQPGRLVRYENVYQMSKALNTNFFLYIIGLHMTKSADLDELQRKMRAILEDADIRVEAHSVSVLAKCSEWRARLSRVVQNGA